MNDGLLKAKVGTRWLLRDDSESKAAASRIFPFPAPREVKVDSVNPLGGSIVEVTLVSVEDPNLTIQTSVFTLWSLYERIPPPTLWEHLLDVEVSEDS